MASIQWPAIPDAHGAALLALQFQLEQSQWWSPEQLQQYQFEQLSQVLTHAYRTVPFYQDYYQSQGYRPKRLLNADHWRRTPLLSRQQIQEADQRLRTTQLPPEHGQTHDIVTSGSTGRNIRVQGSQITSLFWHAFTLRDHLWQQRDLGGKLAAIRRGEQGLGEPPQGSSAPGWGLSTNLVYNTGPSVLLNVHSSVEQQWEWLQREDPEYLLIYPSALLALARLCRERGTEFRKLRGISTLGEIVSPELRQICAEVFAVPLTDMYSCQEAGYLAFQCPQQDHYHVQSENVLLEVLDEQNRPCAPGETGRVVITTLHNFATPLIRYEIGDYAEVGEACSCGRGLPVLKRIMGRVRNLITLPSGDKKWPLLGTDQFNRIAAIAQFQLLQHSVDELEFKLVVASPLSTAQETALTAHLQAALGHPFAIRFTYLDEIPRSAGGKFEDFISLID